MTVERRSKVEENIFKTRAILVDFTLLKDKHGNPNYFLLKLCDNLEVNGYSDLIVLAENPVEARAWMEKNCVGDQNLVYKTNFDLSDDVQHIKMSHKSIGAIISSRFSYEGVNQRLVQIMKILGR